MKHRIILFLVLAILVILIPVSKWLRFPTEIGLCNKDFLCEEFWIRGVFWPMNDSVYYIISSIALLIFFPYSFLKTWMKIMLPYAFIAFFLVVMTSPLCSGMICFDRTLVASGLSKVFLILTILILISKSIYLFVLSKKSKRI
jgi:hypothetical protein